jgi:hypothetical protein
LEFVNYELRPAIAMGIDELVTKTNNQFQRYALIFLIMTVMIS